MNLPSVYVSDIMKINLILTQRRNHITAKALDNLQIFNLDKKGTISESIPLKYLQRYDYFRNLPKKTESIYTFYTEAWP